MRLASFLFFLILVTNIFSQNVALPETTHSPKKATLLSFCIPSAGQFYNHFHRPNKKKRNLLWKLPLIYGGLGASVFFLVDNQNEFNSIKNERLYRLNNVGLIQAYPEYTTTQLEILQNDYRRWRDLSVVSILGVYLLQVLDATIEGHLIHFDNSDKLSIRFQPQFFSATSTPTLLTLNIQF